MVDDRLDIPTDLPVPLQAPRRRKRIQLLWSAVQLICGIVIGVGATLYVFKDRIMWSPPGPNLGEMAMKIVREMQERYSLTDDQFKRVSELVQGSMARRRDMGKAFFDQMSTEDARVKDQMVTILTPEQFNAYAEDMKRMAESHERRRPPFFREGGREGGPGGPGPGPGGPRGPRRQREEGEAPGQRPRGDGETYGPRPRGDGQSPNPWLREDANSPE
ncbi:MAG: hypothetical protein IH624_06830 [Phycisphaerae bacterium]|nr:hypothetical protein [Phycisphaerae bacterium]